MTMKKTGLTRKQDLACSPEPPPGPVKGGSGKQNNVPETAACRGRKDALLEGRGGLLLSNIA